MKVLIDDVLYVPAPPPITGKSLLVALDVRFDSDAGDGLTVRDYLYTLMAALWGEKEGFSSKRPFGNSGWQYNLYKPLIKAGFIGGSLDSEGYVDTVHDGADDYIHDLIRVCFYGAEP